MGVIVAGLLVAVGGVAVAAGVLLLLGLGAALVVVGVEAVAAGLLVDPDVVRGAR